MAEMTEKERQIHEEALRGAIKKDFLKGPVSYQPASDIKYLAGYIREVDNAKTAARKILKDEFNASVVAVGDGMVAIVKRSKA